MDTIRNGGKMREMKDKRDRGRKRGRKRLLEVLCKVNSFFILVKGGRGGGGILERDKDRENS